jgi:hypothetical protein
LGDAGDNIATVGPNDPPRRPETGAPHDDRLALVSVGRRDGWRPAAVAVVAVTLVLGAAVWKPWASDRPALTAGPSNLPGGSAGGLLPPITSGPQPTGAVVPSVPPIASRITFAGLDLGLMGTADQHAAWGVAVAYVSSIQFDNAATRGSSTVTPVVSWELTDPETNPPGSILDHPGVASIGVAATWPAGIHVARVQLFYIGSADPGSSEASEIDLGLPLASQLELVDGSIGPGPTANPDLGLPSGAFYLLSPEPPAEMTGWRSHGWPPGLYQFRVTQKDGNFRSLPFEIGGAPGP